MATFDSDGLFDESGNIRPLKRGARWAIGRAGINFIERTPVDDEQHPLRALALLGIPIVDATLDGYFPRNESGKRCPTFALIRLWYAYLGNRNSNGSVLV